MYRLPENRKNSNCDFLQYLFVWSATEYMYDVEQKTVYAAVMVINDGWRLLNGMIYFC